MVEVVHYDLPLDWPDAQLDILMVHPLIEWHQRQDGFVQTEMVANRSMRLLDNGLHLASEHGARLILVPEYGLPSRRFADCRGLLNQRLPEGTICMAGFDAMDRQQWAQVRNGAENGALFAEKSGAYTWVNTAAIWVKRGPNDLMYFLQPKLEPSPEEGHRGMLRGRHVLHFQVGAWRLTQLICCDFAANRHGNPDAPVLRAVIEGIRANSDVPEVDLFIVLQANDRPGNDVFVQNAVALLNGDGVRAGSVVFANMAGQSQFSSLFLPLYREWPCLEHADTPLDKAMPVFRFRQVQNHPATHAAFREGGAAAHWVTFRSPLRVAPNPRDLNYVESFVAQANEDGEFGPLRPIQALEHYCSVACREAAYALAQELDVQSDAVLRVLQESHTSLSVAFRGGLTPTRLIQIIVTLLGDIGKAKEWEEGVQHRRQAMRLVRALTILLAGGVPLDLDLEDRRQAAPPNDIVHRPITAHAGDFTLDIVAGDPGLSTTSLLEKYLNEEERDKWLSAVPTRHICLLLDAVNADGELTPVDLRSLRCPFGFKPILRQTDNRFETGPLEQHIGNGQRLWKYHYRGLYDLVAQAASTASLVERTREVFGWTAA